MSKASSARPVNEQFFLNSAQADAGVISTTDFFAWLESRRNASKFEVNRISLSDLKDWHFEDDTGNIVHKSGKFFRIEGIEINTNFGNNPHWMQPIINQPEVGILGFLVKEINGIIHFLVQAKMEPGNPNLVQVSPTVQATRSNYTQIHGGKRPLYLDYFLDRSRSRFLVDQLQSEQGARFFRKRNRNMIVQVPDDEVIEVHEDFCWLTLGQLFEVLKYDNTVNMDSRTVLSCIRFAGHGMVMESLFDTKSFSEDLYLSAVAGESFAQNDLDYIISWLTDLKTRYELDVRSVPLNSLKDWIFDGDVIQHRENKYFSVLGVSVVASNREVQSWEQPLVKAAKGGTFCFICQKKNGVMHFLLQAKVEPGNFDTLEFAPTVQCTPINYTPERPELYPTFYDLVVNSSMDQIRYSAVHSEEGGRFYNDEKRFLVIEIDKNQNLDLPENYIWMSIRQMKEFIRYHNYLNIEARSMLSCLGIKVPGS